MKKLLLSSSKVNTETSIPNVFIDSYMRDANGEFVKVYLYLLRCLNMPDLTLSGIADRLNLTEKDIVRALKYWDKHNVISVTCSSGSEPESIVFLPMDSVEQSGMQTAATVDISVTDDKAHSSSYTLTKPSYSPAQIKRLKEQEDIKELLLIVEQYVGKPLSGADINTVLFIRNDLGFSVDLIEYLVEYCVTNQHTSLRYIEKVALAWHEQGITSVNEAKDTAVIRSRRTAAVSRTFGIGDRNLTPIELDFINRWYDEYGFDPEMVEEACRRTIMSMSKPNFSYADGILRKWKTAGIHTLEELKTLDAGFRAKITVPVEAKIPPSKSVNKFNNFSQRTYDFDKIEKTLISNNK